MEGQHCSDSGRVLTSSGWTRGLQSYKPARPSSQGKGIGESRAKSQPRLRSPSGPKLSSEAQSRGVSMVGPGSRVPFADLYLLRKACRAPGRAIIRLQCNQLQPSVSSRVTSPGPSLSWASIFPLSKKKGSMSDYEVSALPGGLGKKWS